jgi:hypothetical protein
VEGISAEASRLLFGYGPIGIYSVVVSIAYWRCSQRAEAVGSERLGDFKAALETINSNNSALADVVEATKARTEASSAIAKAQEMMAAEQARSNAELNRLRDVVADCKAANDRQSAELIRLREEMVRRGNA